MLGGRDITETAVGPLDEDRRLHLAPLAELQPNLTERFAGHRADARRADAQHLQGHVRLRLALGHAHDAPGVTVGQVHFVGLGPRLGQPLLGPGDLFGRRLGKLNGQFPEADREADLVAILGLGQRGVDLGGQVAGHELNLLVGFPGRSGSAEIHVVDVAARCVGHDRHHRRVLLVAVHQLLQPLTVSAIVIGRDAALGHATHVVQRVGRIDGDRSSVGIAQGEDGHRGVGRACRLDEVRTARARIHLHLVDAAERVGGHGALLQEPAAVEHMLRRLGREAGELGRTQPVGGALHAINNPLHHETVIVGELRSRGWHRARGAARRVRMHGRDQDVGRWDANLLLDQAPRLDAHAHLGAQQVEDHQGELRFSVIEHQAPSVQLIVHVRGYRGDKIADNRPPQRRRDVARGGTGPKHGRLGRVCRVSGRRQEKGTQKYAQGDVERMTVMVVHGSR